MIDGVQVVEMIEKNLDLSFECKEKAANTTLTELGLDSLDVLEFLHMMQDKFDTSLKNDRYNKFLSFTPQMIADSFNQNK